MSFFDPGPQILGGLLQDRPKVPPWIDVSAQAAQLKAIRGNQAALPEATQYASSVNAANQAEWMKFTTSMIPDFKDITKTISGNLLSGLKGEIPDFKTDWSSSIAKAFSGGFAGSPGMKNIVARDLNLRAFGIQNEAMSSTERWLATLSGVGPKYADVRSNDVSTSEQINLDFQNASARFQRDWVNNQLKAQYSPGTVVGQAIIKTDDQFNAMLTSLIGSVAGGASGGGGAAAMMCWVAREVFGSDNPKWLAFRFWLLNRGPKWLVKLYAKYGEWFAGFIANKLFLKSLVRRFMESKIKELEVENVHL